MKHGKLYGFGAVFLIILALGSIYYFDPAAFSNLNPNSLLASNTVRIEPRGYKTSSGEWADSWWNVLFTSDSINDQFGFYTFNQDESAKSGLNTVNNQKLEPKSSIQVKIIPEQPYWERPLDVSSPVVYPATKTSHSSYAGAGWAWENPTVSQFSVPVYHFSSQYWIAHTPYTIEVYKNGQKIDGMTTRIDTAGSSQTYKITNPSDSSEWIMVKDIGKLGTGYGEPSGTISNNLAIFSGDTIFNDYDSVMKYLQYSSNDDKKFANYWFGGGNYYTASGQVMQKANDGSPGLFWRQGGLVPVNVVPDAGTFPGIYVQSSGADRWGKPLAASVWSNQPTGTTQSEGRVFQKDGLSVVNYLKQERGLGTMSSNQMNVWGQGWTITTPQSDGKNYLRVYMPKGAMSSLSTLQISTQLADTFVYEPAVANMEITGLSWQVSGQIGDKDVLKVDITQKGTVESDSTLTASFTSGQPVFINPPSQKVSLAPGASTSVYLEFTNLGAQTATNGEVKIRLTNEMGQWTEKSIAYTLLPKGVGGTTLTVLAQDKSTHVAVSGITCAVAWGTKSQTEITNGGTFTVDLEGYTGAVTVTSVETTSYKSATASTTVSSGSNTLILEIEPQGYVPPPEEIDWLLILAVSLVIVVVAAMGAGAYYVSKHGKRRRRY